MVGLTSESGDILQNFTLAESRARNLASKISQSVTGIHIKSVPLSNVFINEKDLMDELSILPKGVSAKDEPRHRAALLYSCDGSGI